MIDPVVSLVILADRPAHLRVLLAALAVQTETRWEALVLDQTSDDERGIRAEVVQAADPRVRHRKVPKHGDWGQREKFAAARDMARGAWCGFPNDDAYYCPVYLERMLRAAEAGGLELVYCDWVFDKFNYQPYIGTPVVGRVDVGGFLVRRASLLSHGWPDTGPTGDGVLVESLVRAGLPHARVAGCYYTKN